jgi:hypothetical protein
MVEKWAIVVGGVVQNICLWDGATRSVENPMAWEPPAGATMVNVQNIFCDIGWLWDGSTFSAPQP